MINKTVYLLLLLGIIILVAGIILDNFAMIYIFPNILLLVALSISLIFIGAYYLIPTGLIMFASIIQMISWIHSSLTILCSVFIILSACIFFIQNYGELQFIKGKLYILKEMEKLYKKNAKKVKRRKTKK